MNFYTQGGMGSISLSLYPLISESLNTPQKGFFLLVVINTLITGQCAERKNSCRLRISISHPLPTKAQRF